MKESTEKKIRLDNLLVDKGLASTRNKAQALIMAGVVEVDGVVIDKAGTFVNIKSDLLLKDKEKYVSRGGLKLEKAINFFNLQIKGITALDIGASTGGFTDCLLKHGAEKVFAFDVGYGQLDWNLRNDKRVVSREKINCRYLKFDDVGEYVDLVTIDVSFISLDKIVKPLIPLIKNKGKIVALIKPQFEVGKNEVEPGGVIRDTKKHNKVKEKIEFLFKELGIQVEGITDSPILGKNGNREYLICGTISSSL